MTNYVRTADFAGKDALISGNPAKAVKGVDLGIEFDAIAAMSATKLDAAASANPTTAVGLAVVNGTAATFMRSDGAPALSQAIVPTWTASHTWKGDAVTALFRNTANAPVLQLGTVLGVTGAGSVSDTALGFFGTNLAILTTTLRQAAQFSASALSFGNTTDNQTYTFQGSGATTIGGALTQNAVSGAVTINSTTATNAAALFLSLGASNKARFGLEGTAGATVTGSLANDAFVYTTGGNFLVATASGTGVAFKVKASNGLSQSLDEAGTLFDVGFRDAPPNSQSADYTLALADRGKTIVNNKGGSAMALTIPPNVSVALPNGAVIAMYNNVGGQNITVTRGAGVTLFLAGDSTFTNANRTVAPGGLATITQYAANIWVISGAGVS